MVLIARRARARETPAFNFAYTKSTWSARLEQVSTRNLKPDAVRGRRACNVLVAGEAALAVALLVGAGLLFRSSMVVSLMDRGVDTHNLMTGQVWLPPARYPSGAEIARFWRQIVDRARSIPGVRSASAVSFLPLSGLGTTTGVVVDGTPLLRPGQEPQVQYWVSGPDYFRTTSISLLEGRVFSEQDNDEAHGVVIVSAAMAARFWPGQSALGKRLRLTIGDTGHYWLPKTQNRWLTVVGIVRDIRLDGMSQNVLSQIYLPYAQNPSAILHLVVRTEGDLYRWSSAIRESVLSLDKGQPLFDEKSLQDVLAATMTRSTLVMRGLALAALIALLLACAGIYGVSSYVVSQRTRETGIRLALGAEPHDVVRLQLRRSMMTVLFGTVIGIGASLAGTSVLRSMLVGVTTTDITTLTVTPLVFLLTASVASWLPARRAVRIDPVKALRQE